MGLKYRNGFTMIQQLFSLFTIIIMLPLVILLFQIVSPTQKAYFLEANTFFQMLYHMTLESDDIDVKNNTLFIQNRKGENVSIEKYKQLIRRRVNNEGHEVLLRNIKQIDFEKHKTYIIVSVRMDNDEFFKKSFEITR